MNSFIGLDIGGTKCAVILGKTGEKDSPEIIDKLIYITKEHPGAGMMIPKLHQGIDELLAKHNLAINQIAAIGISCGGPLDSRKGIIMSPPNLPGWDDVYITEIFRKKYGIPVAVQNDANACALAEWKFGAGRGYSNVIFLTFGTGMGAGLILNGKLYEGTNDNAGEVGHIRLAPVGPVGYGKAGSFEGFCSGGGIAQLAKMKALEKLQKGETLSFCKTISDLESITAKSVAEAASAGDPLAIEIWQMCGDYLGRGLAVLMDILNPEVIILGSIYVRSGHLLQPAVNRAVEREALPLAGRVCKIVPAELDNTIGDLAALSVALNAL